MFVGRKLLTLKNTTMTDKKVYELLTNLANDIHETRGVLGIREYWSRNKINGTLAQVLREQRFYVKENRIVKFTDNVTYPFAKKVNAMYCTKRDGYQKRHDTGVASARRMWSDSDISLLKKLISQKYSPVEIEKALGRSPQAVAKKAHSLGLALPTSKKPIAKHKKAVKKRNAKKKTSISILWGLVKIERG